MEKKKDVNTVIREILAIAKDGGKRCGSNCCSDCKGN